MPVFFWRTVARSTAYPLGAMSSTLRATTSQPRSLLSIATLNIAKSRVRPAICSLVRIDQTCFGRSGGLAPTNLPLFQGTRFGAAGAGLSLSCNVYASIIHAGHGVPTFMQPTAGRLGNVPKRHRHRQISKARQTAIGSADVLMLPR